MANELLLVGTNHGDPFGFDRLVRIYQRFRPDRVTLEHPRGSTAGVNQGRVDSFIDLVRDTSQADEEVNELFLSLLRMSLLAYGYEYRFCHTLSLTGAAPIRHVDNYRPKEGDTEPLDYYSQIFGGVSTVATHMTIWSKLTGMADQKVLQAIFDLSGYLGKDVSKVERDWEALSLRDAGMEREIRNLHAQGGRTMHIGGLAHFFNQYVDEHEQKQPNLYDRLEDLHPQRMALCQIDLPNSTPYGQSPLE